MNVRDSQQRRNVAIGMRRGRIAGCCLAFVMCASAEGVLWGGVIVKVETPQGVVTIEIESAEADVPVISVSDRHEIRICRGDEGLDVEVADDEGSPVLKVRDGGTELTGESLTVRRGSGETYRIGLSPLTAKAPFNADQAQELQQTWAEEFGVSPKATNAIGMEFRLIPPGTFLMGSPDKEVDALVRDESNEYWKKYYKSEAPQHRVTISRPFMMGRHPVTRGQFRQFVDATDYVPDSVKDGEGGYPLKGGWKKTPGVDWHYTPGLLQTDEHPVINVSWNDAVAFCDWLSAEEERQYLLPTEAQWEYACRAGKAGRWSVPDDNQFALNDYAWYTDSGDYGTHPVGLKTPNAFGLFDMHGHVFEWCRDWYAEDYYGRAPSTDPTGPETGEYRVMRSGSFAALPRNVRSAARNVLESTGRTPFVGFRVAYELEAP